MVVAIDEVKGRQDDDRTDCRGDLVAAALFILRATACAARAETRPASSRICAQVRWLSRIGETDVAATFSSCVYAGILKIRSRYQLWRRLQKSAVIKLQGRKGPALK